MGNRTETWLLIIAIVHRSTVFCFQSNAQPLQCGLLEPETILFISIHWIRSIFSSIALFCINFLKNKWDFSFLCEVFNVHFSSIDEYLKIFKNYSPRCNEVALPSFSFTMSSTTSSVLFYYYETVPEKKLILLNYKKLLKHTQSIQLHHHHHHTGFFFWMQFHCRVILYTVFIVVLLDVCAHTKL